MEDDNDGGDLEAVFIVISSLSSEPSHTFSYGGCLLGINGGWESGNGGGGGGELGGGKSSRPSMESLSLLSTISLSNRLR